MKLQLNLTKAIEATKDQEPTTSPEPDQPILYHIQRLEAMLQEEGVPLQDFKDGLQSISTIIQEQPDLHVLLTNQHIGTISKAIIKAKDIELTPAKKPRKKPSKKKGPALADSLDISSLGDLKL